MTFIFRHNNRQFSDSDLIRMGKEINELLINIP